MNRKVTLTVIGVMLGLLVGPHGTQADTPSVMNYQGRVVQGDNLVNQSGLSLRLRLYTTAGGSTYLYEEADLVDVVDGLYSTVLGDNQSGGTASSLPDALSTLGTNAWLGIKLGTEAELTPRERLLAAPFALQLRGVYVSDSGSVGIGTTSPGQPLDVDGDALVGGGISGYDGASEHLGIRGRTDTWYLGVQNETLGSASDFYVGLSVGEDGIFHIENNGNVGIGTTDPEYKLHVAGMTALEGHTAIGGAPNDHRLTVYGSGSGVSRTALYVTNSHSTGIAQHNATHGSDVNTLLSQYGIGDFLYCDNNVSGWTRVIRLMNDGTVQCKVLDITGGSDVAEPFDVVGDCRPEPGMVMAIAPAHPGKLKVCDRAYDRGVAGIVSGAGGVKPGVMMRQAGSEADGQHPIALSGRTYCWADATDAPIRPGDLLTSSRKPGHAMKVQNYGRANGAVIGKAMTSLPQGQGLVLVLVNLQ